jgi:ribosomal protein S21
MKHNRKFDKTLQGVIEVTHHECGGDAEKMVRRFCKKVKKEKIVEEFRDRSHFIKETTRRSTAKRRKEALIKKVNKRREDLLSTKRDPTLRRRKKK